MSLTPDPRLGVTVLYTLDATDAAKVSAWRANFAAFNAKFAGHKHPHEPGRPGATGHVAHTGSAPAAGDVLAATVVAVPDPESGRLNLKVHLDGNDDYWATCVPEGKEPGTWAWRT